MTIDQTAERPSLRNAPWTDDAVDPYFGAPFVDVDEERTSPVRHRYVHGGFEGTDTLFSFYFPDTGAYEGRFFQHVTPVPQSENLAPQIIGEHNKIAFAAGSGAYFVETNGGGPNAANPFSGMDPTIGAFRASAAAARFSRRVAREIYGAHRPFGYLYGGSGGAYRTIGSSENTDGVWDGFVPYVPGSPMSIPNVFSVRMHAQRMLRERFPDIVDAYDVGGDPASLELTPDERDALDEVTRMGFPPRSWFGWRTMGMHAFSVLYPGVMAADPTYSDDFWSRDGYLGADPDASIHRDRVQLASTIAELITTQPAPAEDLAAGGVDESYLHTGSPARSVSAVRLADRPEGWMLGAQLRVMTGSAAGGVLQLAEMDGATAVLEPGQIAIAAGLAVGDEVVLDNSSFLAAQTYHRHQVPGPEYAVWDQFRGVDGAPVHPQRPMLLGPLFTQGAAGALPTGRISGKMIAVACLLDREAFPWQADWYRRRVEEHLGEQTDDRFRLWFVDNALHGDDEAQEFPTRTVDYVGALEAALRAVSAWVESEIEPPRSTEYSVEDGQVLLRPTEDARSGVQPVVRVTVNGEESAIVRSGDPVKLCAEATAPKGGIIVAAVADFTGAGILRDPLPIEPAERVALEQSLMFSEPGTYFVAVRVSAQVGGSPATPFACVQNIARARVVVAG